MNKKLKHLLAGTSVFALALAGLVVLSPTAQAASPGDILSPFDTGQGVCVYQGYDHGTHTGTSEYGLDLVAGNCSATSAAGLTVHAPVAGSIYYWQAAYGNLCINIAGGKSITLTHINATVTSGSVSAGQVVGAVGNAGTLNNNGVAHVHFEVWSSPGCYNGSVIPFDSAHGTRICGAPDLVASPGGSFSNGTWSHTTFVSDSCGTGAPPDTDGDGTPDSSDILPTIAGPAANRGAPLQTSRLSGDFNGDGKQDLAAFYDYGGGETRLFTFNGTGGGSFAAPVIAWDSGLGNWSWSNMKPVVGDFNGDGKADIVAFYDYGGGLTKIWEFFGSSTGTFATPTMEWSSGVGNWDWPRFLPLVGDFNGDGKADITGFYDYSGGETRLFTFVGNGTGAFAAPIVSWDSGLGNWDWQRAKPVVGDFNGDGKADIATFYDYGSGDTKIWEFVGSSSSTFATPTMKWDSGVGMWEWSHLTAMAGDFNGDGKQDLTALYAYNAGDSRLFTFAGDGTGAVAAPVEEWYSGTGNWSAPNTKPVVGDLNGDGKADIAAFYDYGGGLTKIWEFVGSSAGTFATPTLQWDSGVGNWEWPRILTP